TRLKIVMGKDSSNLIYEMIAEKYEKVSGYQSDEMSLGVLREPWAIDEYCQRTGQVVTDGGYITKGDFLGLSPDGLIGEKKAVEVKSPSLKKHIEYVVKNTLPSEYKWQVVHYFLVIDDLEEVDFISYNPNFPLKELLVIKVKREDLQEDIEKAERKVEEFIEKYNKVMIELL
ncbi:MAG: YqaJ viral recombinase family protein, partial [Patescibacteria group bacterium]